MQIRAQADSKKFGTCGCGRSPTGQCRGWHGLTEEQYQIALKKYLTEQSTDTRGTHDHS